MRVFLCYTKDMIVSDKFQERFIPVKCLVPDLQILLPQWEIYNGLPVFVVCGYKFSAGGKKFGGILQIGAEIPTEGEFEEHFLPLLIQKAEKVFGEITKDKGVS